ncbi:GDSL-type esterase/lipase family protein [Methylobacterium terricola]|nr:GDSL-type esterase/lipase family protein [Methylobacterium terricola]
MPRRAALTLAAFVSTALGTAVAHADHRRILIYGDSNTWGYEARSDGGPTRRLPPDRRWTGLVQQALGPDDVLIEDGLNLRTTDLDGEDWPGSVIRPDTINGARHLPASIAANMPVDLVVIMLGTNDLQARYRRSATDIAKAAVGLAQIVQSSAGGIGTAYPAPKVLLVSPVEMAAVPIEEWGKRYAGGQDRSAGFAAAFRDAARKAGIPAFDAAAAIGGAAHGIDGIHLSEADHRKLAGGLAPAIREALGEP